MHTKEQTNGRQARIEVIHGAIRRKAEGEEHGAQRRKDVGRLVDWDRHQNNDRQ